MVWQKLSLTLRVTSKDLGLVWGKVKHLAGLESLTKTSAALPPARKEEDSMLAARSLQTPASARLGMAEGGTGTPSPKAFQQAGRPARERDRLTFFSSLRRKASGGDTQNSDENGHLHGQVIDEAAHKTVSSTQAMLGLQPCGCSIPSICQFEKPMYHIGFDL